MIDNPSAQSGGGGPYDNFNVYTALVVETPFNPPSSTILQNSLGGVPVWSYVGIGQYRLTLAGVFSAGKTIVFITIGAAELSLPLPCIIAWERESVDAIRFDAYTVDGGLALINTDLNNVGFPLSLEIRVYP